MKFAKQQTALLSSVIVAIAMLTIQPALGYEVPTHVWLLDKSLEALGPDHPLFLDLTTNNARGQYAANASENGDGNQEIGTTLLEGVAEEDHWLEVPGSRRLPFDSAQRVLDHFWYPDENVTEGLLDKDSSLTKATKLFSLAVDTYCSDKNRAYWYLGRVAHLLQDAASPAHVHLDLHLPVPNSEADSLEKWMARTDDITGRPNHESTQVGLYLEMKFPTYEVPAGYDPRLVALFYTMAMKAREFDSDDSGKPWLDGYTGQQNHPSLIAQGRQNSGRIFLAASNLFHSDPPAVAIRKQPLGQCDYFMIGDPLGRGSEYEFDNNHVAANDTWREDGLYLSITGRIDLLRVEKILANGVITLAQTNYSALKCFDAAALASATSQQNIPTSILNQEHRILMGHSIFMVEQLLEYFWTQVQPLELLDLDINLPGTPARVTYNGDFISAGKGANVTIKVNQPLASLGLPNSTAGLVDLTNAPGQPVVITAGNTNFRSVNVGTTLVIKGNAKIKTLYNFYAKHIEVHPEVKVLEIYEGWRFQPNLPAVGLVPFGNVMHVYQTSDAMAWSDWAQSNANDPSKQLKFSFYSQRNYKFVEANIMANGGVGLRETNGNLTFPSGWRMAGADGGLVEIHAPKSQSKLSITCNGSSSGTGDGTITKDYELPSGGNGGAISIIGESLAASPILLQANGGLPAGGGWYPSDTGTLPRPAPREGFPAGHGGHGGSIKASLKKTILPAGVYPHIQISANGQSGKQGGLGESGFYEANRPAALDGAAGGNGGAGGMAGQLIGLEFLAALALGANEEFSTEPGSGGSGGGGGYGFVGGRGGDGGKAGGLGALDGRGGFGSFGDVSPGADGELGVVETTLSQVEIPNPTHIFANCPEPPAEAALIVIQNKINRNILSIVAPNLGEPDQWQMMSAPDLLNWSPILAPTNSFGLMQLNVTNTGSGSRFFKVQRK